MKLKIMYWLLAHFPRPVAVLYAMLIETLYTDSVNQMFILLGLGCVVLFLGLIGLATTGPLAIGSLSLSVCSAFLFGFITVGITIRASASLYRTFNEALPKREKKQEEADV